MNRHRAVNLDEGRLPKEGQQVAAAVNAATILSVNADAAPNVFRVSLQWQGHYDISDFDLQRFGKVLEIQDKTPNTGWAIIEHPVRMTIAQPLPGWAILTTPPLSPGNIIPLRPDLLRRSRNAE